MLTSSRRYRVFGDVGSGIMNNARTRVFGHHQHSGQAIESHQ